MMTKKILSFLLSLSLAVGCIPTDFAFAAQDSRRQRQVYIHAQGENPTKKTDVSTVYTDEVADIYFAVDNPNMGRCENGEHIEPQYDMNGYTATIYFDAEYFDYASAAAVPIDYTVPDKNFPTSGSVDESVSGGSVEAPSSMGLLYT